MLINTGERDQLEKTDVEAVLAGCADNQTLTAVATLSSNRD
jgi:hypothetical protein